MVAAKAKRSMAKAGKSPRSTAPNYQNDGTRERFHFALLRMLEVGDGILSWQNGSVHIADPMALQREILPRFMRTDRYESFLRQLHLYRFRKVHGKGRWNPATYAHPDLIEYNDPRIVLQLRPRSAFRHPKPGQELGESVSKGRTAKATAAAVAARKDRRLRSASESFDTAEEGPPRGSSSAATAKLSGREAEKRARRRTASARALAMDVYSSDEEEGSRANANSGSGNGSDYSDPAHDLETADELHRRRQKMLRYRQAMFRRRGGGAQEHSGNVILRGFENTDESGSSDEENTVDENAEEMGAVDHSVLEAYGGGSGSRRAGGGGGGKRHFAYDAGNEFGTPAGWTAYENSRRSSDSTDSSNGGSAWVNRFGHNGNFNKFGSQSRNRYPDADGDDATDEESSCSRGSGAAEELLSEDNTSAPSGAAGCATPMDDDDSPPFAAAAMLRGLRTGRTDDVWDPERRLWVPAEVVQLLQNFGDGVCSGGVAGSSDVAGSGGGGSMAGSGGGGDMAGSSGGTGSLGVTGVACVVAAMEAGMVVAEDADEQSAQAGLVVTAEMLDQQQQPQQLLLPPAQVVQRQLQQQHCDPALVPQVQPHVAVAPCA